MITDERLKQLMAQAGMPESISLMQVLRQCDTEARLSEREQLAKDAARYRWLRDNKSTRVYEAGGLFRVECHSLHWEPSFDAAIDAAMAGANA